MQHSAKPHGGKQRNVAEKQRAGMDDAQRTTGWLRDRQQSTCRLQGSCKGLPAPGKRESDRTTKTPCDPARS